MAIARINVDPWVSDVSRRTYRAVILSLPPTVVRSIMWQRIP